MKRLGLILFAALACYRDPITAPDDTIISLVATSPAVPLDGVVDLVATVIDPTGKTVKDGTPITLSCCTALSAQVAAAAGAAVSDGPNITSTLGTLEPALVRTAGGKATARFRAGPRSGTAHIIARSGGARPGTVQLAIGGAALARIALVANPAIVSSASGSVDVIAVATDDYGNVVSGVSVAFSTSAGTLSDANITTDANGRASVRLTTNLESIVTVVAGAHSASAIIRRAPPPALSMSATPASPMVGDAVQFSIEATQSAGGAPLRELFIDFGDGSRTTITGLAGTTNVSHAYASPGMYHVTSTVIDVIGEQAISTAIIPIIARPPITVVLEVPAGQTVTIDVPFTVNAIINPSSEQRRVVRFEWDLGDDTRSTTTGHACTHVFTSLGLRVMSVTAVLSDGTRSSAETTVVVRPSS